MIRQQLPSVAAEDAAIAADSEEYISPAPRVSVQAFCETAETAAGTLDVRLEQIQALAVLVALLGAGAAK